MTFTKIKNNRATYVNPNGIVFTPCTGSDKIKVSYHIDSQTDIQLTYPTAVLATLFECPDKVDYMALSHSALV